MGSGRRKPLHFIGSSQKDLRAMPEDVQDVFGSALLDAQYGDVPEGLERLARACRVRS
jgi:phage-related protein